MRTLRRWTEQALFTIRPAGSCTPHIRVRLGRSLLSPSRPASTAQHSTAQHSTRWHGNRRGLPKAAISQRSHGRPARREAVKMRQCGTRNGVTAAAPLHRATAAAGLAEPPAALAALSPWQHGPSANPDSRSCISNETGGTVGRAGSPPAGQHTTAASFWSNSIFYLGACQAMTAICTAFKPECRHRGSGS